MPIELLPSMLARRTVPISTGRALSHCHVPRDGDATTSGDVRKHDSGFGKLSAALRVGNLREQ